MKRTEIKRRALSLLMVLAMTLSLLPAAMAADTCPRCGSVSCTRTAVKAANCHETGVDKYECSACAETTLLETPVAPQNHDAYCVDNGDGATHTASCPFHPGYTGVKEAHTFVDGRCERCLAVDYESVKLVLPEELTLYVDLGDTSAVASLGTVSITAGGADVTGEYTLRYNWYLGGEPVGTGRTYQLPAELVKTQGDYSLVCFVMAVAKNGISTENAACTVTVHVRDMLAANAAISTRDLYFAMGDTTSRIPVSVAEQIYKAFYARTGKYPEFVRFDEKPLSSVGQLKSEKADYYFTPAAGQASLAELRFESARSASGTYSIAFTAYDLEGNSCPGMLTITVERSLDDMSVSYSAVSGGYVSLKTEDFDLFWQKTYSQGKLTLVRFTALPGPGQGALYGNFTSVFRPGTPLQAGDELYREGQGRMLLESAAFLAGQSHTGCVVLPFEAYGVNNRGVQTYLSGNVFIFVTAGEVAEVTTRVASGTSAVLKGEDFLSVYRAAADATDSGFYIQFLDAPTRGVFYLGRTASSSGTRLTAANLSSISFHYHSDHANKLSDLTYVPGTAGESLRYAAYDTLGNLLYIGRLTFSLASYSKSFADVKPTNWFYTYVMDLAQAGVINGMTDTTYSPDSEVTYGQALKLIMLAAGYAQQAPTGKSWASGYLTAAQKDGLLPSTVTEADLNRKITRYAIAEIAAKAMKLPAPTTDTSPFSDMTMSVSYAPYVLALYEAKIVEGSAVNGQVKFYGVNSIRRSEMATIVWRINNYKK